MLEEIKIKIEEIVITIVQALKTLPAVVRLVLITAAIAIIPGFFLIRFVSQAWWNHQYAGFRIEARPSFQNPKQAVVSPVTVLALGNNNYAAYAQVTNDNFELAADNITYNFSFKTGGGDVAASKSGSLFLLPSEKKYLVVPRFSAPEAIVSGTLTLDPVHWQKRFSIPRVSLTGLRPDLSAQVATDPFTVEAAVRNDSPYQLKKVDLIMLAYGPGSQIKAVIARQELTVNPGEVRKFPVSWPGLDPLTIVKIDVLPQTDVLDSNNLLLMESAQGGSDLRRPSRGF